MRKKGVAKLENEHHSGGEFIELFKSCRQKAVCSCVNFIVAPPYTHLSEIVKLSRGTGIGVAAQDCATEAKGAYTGRFRPG